jgi:threonylcarbamoyladenosine tRNA methylthiotransferase MtaB
MRTASLITLGCKLNRYETEAMRELLEFGGFRTVPWGSPCDLAVINTCTVTHRADRQSRNLILRAARMEPKPFICVTGCYPEAQSDRVQTLPGVDLILGNREKDRILEYLGLPSPPRKVMLSRFENHTRAFLKVQDGCDSRCTYCIIPYVRGPSRSRPKDEVIEETYQLVQSGYKEIILTGIHVGRYGKDLENGVDLVQLMTELERIPGLRRLRISSIEPNEVTDHLIDHAIHSTKLCHHLHLPLQSGDDGVLSRMRRAYGADDYASSVEKLTHALPEVAIGADVMVGFPGETEEAFRNTCTLIESLPLAYLHIFPYSMRPGTVAASMDGQISETVKKNRCAILREIDRNKRIAFRRTRLGDEMEVLVHNQRDRETGSLVGLTHNYLRLLFEGHDGLMNQFVPVKVTQLIGTELRAELV